MDTEGFKSEEESGTEEESLKSVTPDIVRRRCTDVPWFISFILASVLFCFVAEHSIAEGDLARLEVFQDGAGRPCLYHPETVGKMFLLFCVDMAKVDPVTLTNGLDLEHPVCVSACPNFTTKVVEECGGVPGASSYPTVNHMNMLCLPTENMRWRQQLAAWSDIATETVLARIIIERWDSLITSSVVAIVLSYFFIWLLQGHARTLVTLGIILIALATSTLGLFFLGFFHWLASFAPGLREMFDDAPDDWQLLGFALFAFGMGFATMSCAMRRSFRVASSCIEMSCTCVLQTPMLIVHPLIVSLACGLLIFMLVYIALLLLSTGRKVCLHNKVDATPSHLNQVYWAFLVLFGAWAHQTLFMVSEFVVVYASATWCFNGGLRGEGKVERGVILRAWRSCMWYHLGTCIYGAMAVGFSRPFSLTLGAFIGFLELRGNAVGGILSACCGCCANFFETWVRPVNKIAIIDVVMNSAHFCEAAGESLKVVRKQEVTVRILNGATWLFQVAGLAFVGVVGAVVAIFRSAMMHDCPTVMIVTGAAGAAIAVLVAMPFAMIFDTVSDTILYCHQLERMRNTETNWATCEKENRDGCCVPCVSRFSAMLDLYPAEDVIQDMGSPEVMTKYRKENAFE